MSENRLGSFIYPNSQELLTTDVINSFVVQAVLAETASDIQQQFCV
jgi:hypothetical protein